MKHTRISAAAAALSLSVLALSACGIYGTFKSENTKEIEKIEIPSYRDIFTDADLLSLIDTALANNLNLRIAHERVRQADAKLTAARLAYLPRIFLGGNPAVSISNTEHDFSNLSYTLGTASWEIDIFGRVTNRKRIAKMYGEQMKDFEQAARAELIASVAEMYFNLQMLDASIAASDSAVANWKNYAAAMRDMKNAGIEDEAAVAQFEGSYYNEKAANRSLRLTRQQAENAMLLLLGKNGGEIRRRSITAARDLDINLEAVRKIDLRALRIRPDVKAAEMQMAQSFYNVNLARANCCPSITIDGTLGWANKSLIYGAVGGLLQPIFNAGENITQVKVSKSQFEESKLAYAEALLKAGTEVNDAIAGINAGIDKAEDCGKRVEVMKTALEATTFKKKLGRGTYLEILLAQNNLLDAQISDFRNTTDILTNSVKLFHALGGGKQ